MTDEDENDKAKKKTDEAKAPTEGGQQRRNDAKTPSMPGPTFAAAESHVKDLSQELVLALPRGDGELVKCRRILGDHYRCNWWGRQVTGREDRPEMAGLLVTTHRVIRSQMVRARKGAQGLVVEPGSRQ